MSFLLKFVFAVYVFLKLKTLFNSEGDIITTKTEIMPISDFNQEIVLSETEFIPVFAFSDY